MVRFAHSEASSGPETEANTLACKVYVPVGKVPENEKGFADPPPNGKGVLGEAEWIVVVPCFRAIDEKLGSTFPVAIVFSPAICPKSWYGVGAAT